MLKGKAKVDILEYYNSSTIKFLLNNIDFEDLPIIVQHAIIINCFDVFGYSIQIEILAKNMYSFRIDYTKVFDTELCFPNRPECTINAIEKCCEIYNNLIQ